MPQGPEQLGQNSYPFWKRDLASFSLYRKKKLPLGNQMIWNMLQQRGLMCKNYNRLKSIYISGTFPSLKKEFSRNRPALVWNFIKFYFKRGQQWTPIDIGLSQCRVINVAPSSFSLEAYSKLGHSVYLQICLKIKHLPFHSCSASTIYVFDKHLWSAYYVLSTVQYDGDHVEQSVLFLILVRRQPTIKQKKIHKPV